MAHLSLADFVSYVSKSGPSKLTKVRQLKHRPAYRPFFDFYRPIREAIVALHRTGGGSEILERVLRDEDDPRRLRGFPAVIDGYRRFARRHDAQWFDPPRVIFPAGALDISVNPELGLMLDGEPIVVKLYFCERPLTKRSMDVVMHLMHKATGPLAPAEAHMGVLDVRRSKLFRPTVAVRDADALLHSELAWLETAWDEV